MESANLNRIRGFSIRKIGKIGLRINRSVNQLIRTDYDRFEPISKWDGGAAGGGDGVGGGGVCDGAGREGGGEARRGRKAGLGRADRGRQQQWQGGDGAMLAGRQG